MSEPLAERGSSTLEVAGPRAVVAPVLGRVSAAPVLGRASAAPVLVVPRSAVA